MVVFINEIGALADITYVDPIKKQDISEIIVDGLNPTDKDGYKALSVDDYVKGKLICSNLVQTDNNRKIVFLTKSESEVEEMDKELLRVKRSTSLLEFTLQCLKVTEKYIR